MEETEDREMNDRERKTGGKEDREINGGNGN